MVESVRCMPEPFGSMVSIRSSYHFLPSIHIVISLQVSTLVDVCAYAGTGNVLKIQNLLHLCSEHYETKEDKKKKVAFLFHLSKRI